MAVCGSDLFSGDDCRALLSFPTDCSIRNAEGDRSDLRGRRAQAVRRETAMRKPRRPSVLDDDTLSVIVDPDGDVTGESDLCARCGLARDQHAGQPGECRFLEVEEDL
jgi:hypothetical protein